MFEPKSLSIRELFDSTNTFKVPDYQRSYSWQDEQVEQLWEDIYNSYLDNKDKEDKENYFLGSVVTVKAQKNQKKEYKNYQDIVDGQQRLTTLMILFCVVRDLYLNINKSKFVQKSYLEDRIKFDNEDFRLITCSEDMGKFTETILEKDSIKRLEGKPSKKDLSKNKAEDNFKNTAYIFKQKLKECSEKEDIGEIIDYLCNNVTMIMITCASQPFAIKLFQILNDRGLDLTVSDLVKACLMQKISQDKNKREQFKNDWNSVKKTAEGIDNLTLDDMLTLYVYYHLGKNPKKSTNDEFEDLIKKRENPLFTEDSTVIINNFKNFCEHCDEKLNYGNDQCDKVIYSLHYLPWKMHWRAILLTALMENYPASDYQNLIKALRKFYYTYWIAGYTLNKVKTTSFDIIRDIKNKKRFDEIQKRIDNKIEKDKAKIKAEENLNNNEVGYEKWIKPLLLMINYNLAEESIGFIKLDKKLHLEHILPQKYKNKWPYIAKEVADQHMESIGNLTLVSGKKNIVASDKSFEEKIKIYKGESNTAKGITKMDITFKIAEKYQQWDENSIKEHSQWYLEEVDKLLDIGCSKRDGA